jgi:predicted nucleic acid-binding protein
LNVMIDTNVLLDDILTRSPNVEHSRKISHLIQAFLNEHSKNNTLGR